ncbi:MAG: hypothetical protein RIQ60_240 [Pseudomonadota bacterium]|jgi:hypothetical protein
MKTFQVVGLALASAALVAACGGGKSSGSSGNTIVTGQVTLSGVVSTGSPTVNALKADSKVSAKCLNASGGATQNAITVQANGSYEVVMDNSSLPCVLSVDTAQPLASLARGSGPGKATANITPVTTLVVAKVAGKDPVQFIADFSAGTSAVITTDGLNAAITVVKDVLAKAGVALTGVVDVFTDTVTKNASLASAVDSYDLAVAKLADTIDKAGITIATVSTDVAAVSSASSGSTATVAATKSGTPSLPADLVLKPAAPTCSALRSGDYIYIDLMPDTSIAAGNAPVKTINYITFDASTSPVQVLGTGTTTAFTTLSPVSGDPCHFVAANGFREFVVSQSGVVVGRFTEDAGVTHHASIGFPRQTMTPANLAGQWNGMDFSNNSGQTTPVFSPEAGTVTFDVLGAVSAASCFNQVLFPLSASACPAQPGPFPTITANADGGLNVADSGTPGVNGAQIGRMFGYRAGGGEDMAVLIYDDGSFNIFSRFRALSLPVVGTVSNFWNVDIASNLLSPTKPAGAGLAATGFPIGTNTVMSASGSTFTRDQGTLGANPTDRHTESLQINTPRSGYTHRGEGLSVATQAVPAGTTSYSEFVSLNLRGMGVNALGVKNLSTNTTALPKFSFSIVK